MLKQRRQNAEQSAVARGHPFEGHIHAGVEHEPVAHVGFHHVVVQHRRLPDDSPFQPALHDIALRLDLGRRVNIVDAREQRIAHPSPGVQIVPVSVHRHRGSVDELRALLLLHAAVHHVHGANAVGEIGRLGFVVGKRRDYRADMEHVVHALHQRAAVRLDGKIAFHHLHAVAVILLRRRAERAVLRARAEHEYAHKFDIFKLQQLPQCLAAHVAACSRERHFDLHTSLLLISTLLRRPYLRLTKSLQNSYFIPAHALRASLLPSVLRHHQRLSVLALHHLAGTMPRPSRTLCGQFFPLFHSTAISHRH